MFLEDDYYCLRLLFATTTITNALNKLYRLFEQKIYVTFRPRSSLLRLLKLVKEKSDNRLHFDIIKSDVQLALYEFEWF